METGQKADYQKSDVAFIPQDIVHASFNKFDIDVKILAILGPATGDAGYELEGVSERDPRKSLRQTQLFLVSGSKTSSE